MLEVTGHADTSTPSGGRNVKALRRCGTRPIGAAPHSVPTWSAQAPAAFTTDRAMRVWPLAKPRRHTAGAPKHAQETLVQRMDIDVHRHRVQQSAQHGLGPQAGKQGHGAIPVESAQCGAGVSQFMLQRIERLLLTGQRQIQGATRVQQWLLGKSFRRLQVKRTAGPRQGAHHGWPVTLHEHRRRAAGGVVTGLGFALEQHDAAVRRQSGGDRCAGNTGADDGKVKNGLIGHERSRSAHWNRLILASGWRLD